MSKPSNAVETWYLKERGITPETLERCKVTTTDTEARWPLGSTFKIRTGFGPGERRVFKLAESGHPLATWHLPVKSADITDPVIVCEGETDAMRLWQEGGKDMYGQISALPGCDALTPEAAEKLAKRSSKAQLYFVLDNEQNADKGDYNPDDWKDKKNPVRKVDESWKKIKGLLPQARRLYLPDGYKDLCEYFEIYSIKDFDEFVLKADPHYNYERLDLTGPAIHPEFLWQDVVPRAQFSIWQGESNVGKSMLYQALAVALTNGEKFFMGKLINPERDGRVFIVDEENPEAVIRERLSKLGLRPEAQKKLFIVSQRSVRLDIPASSDKLYEDVSNFNPDLVVFDSFIRLHAQDEDSSGAVSKMYNQAVLPLSRHLGASVVLLHHTKKNDSGDSMKRTRGSSDITAGCDVAWDLVDRVDETPYKFFSRFKTRSGAIRKEIRFRIEDTAEGGLEFPLVDSTKDVL
jgi:hypothetical protein